MMMLAKKQTGTGEENLFDVYLTKVADKFSFLLRLDPIRRNGKENISVSNQERLSTYKSGMLPTTRNIMVMASFFGSLMMASSSDWMST